MKKILYIERSKMFQLMMKDLIGKYGYDIIQVSSGSEAIDYVETKGINYILTAYVLDDMSAKEFIQRLNEKGINNCPIVLITSLDEIKNVKSFFKIGIKDYILKKDLSSEDTIKALLNDLK